MSDNEKTKMAPGRYAITEAILTNYTGRQLDIATLIYGFEVHENINLFFSEYKFNIVDGYNLIEDFKISGNEFLELSIIHYGDTSDTTKTIKLAVVGYDGYARPNNRATGYVMRCVKPSAIAASVKTVNKSMDGSLTSMIEILWNEITSPDDKLLNTANKSIGVHKVVWPGITYVEAISACLRKANAPEKDTYHFYDTLWADSVFSEYSVMINSDEYDNYKLNHFDIADAQSIKDHNLQKKAIRNITSNLNFSNYDSYKSGAVTSTFHNFDISKKFYEIKKFDVNKDKTSRIENNPTVYSDYKVNGFSSSDLEEGISLIRTTNSYSYGVNSTLSDIQQATPEFTLNKLATSQNISAVSHEITLLGDSKFHAGLTIDIQIPKATDLIMRNIAPDFDEYQSGKYLVYGITHNFNEAGQYFMNVQLTKDSLKL